MEELAILFKIRDALKVLISNGKENFREALKEVNLEIDEEIRKMRSK